MSYEHDPPNYDEATSPPCYEEATEHTLIDTNKVEQSRNSDLKTLLRRYMIFLLIPITIGIIVYLYYAAVDLNRLVAEKERMNVTQVFEKEGMKVNPDVNPYDGKIPYGNDIIGYYAAVDLNRLVAEK